MGVDPVARDAARVVAREQQRLAQVQDQQEITRLLDKDRALRAEATIALTFNAVLDRLEAAEARLAELTPAEPYAPEEQDEEQDEEQVLRAARRDHRVVEFSYTDREGAQSCRLVSPYEVAEARDGTFLIGWDHDREAIRQFNVERVEYVILVPDAEESYREPPV